MGESEEQAPLTPAELIKRKWEWVAEGIAGLHVDGCAAVSGHRCNCGELLTSLASPTPSKPSGPPLSLRCALLLVVVITAAAAAWWFA